MRITCGDCKRFKSWCGGDEGTCWKKVPYKTAASYPACNTFCETDEYREKRLLCSDGSYGILVK